MTSGEFAEWGEIAADGIACRERLIAQEKEVSKLKEEMGLA